MSLGGTVWGFVKQVLGLKSKGDGLILIVLAAGILLLGGSWEGRIFLSALLCAHGVIKIVG